VGRTSCILSLTWLCALPDLLPARRPQPPSQLRCDASAEVHRSTHPPVQPARRLATATAAMTADDCLSRALTGVSTGYVAGAIGGALTANWSDVPLVLRNRAWPALLRTGAFCHFATLSLVLRDTGGGTS
jgi:hypothetical protein